MLNIAETSFLGFRRVGYSSAWLHYASITFGVSMEEVYVPRPLSGADWSIFLSIQFLPLIIQFCADIQ